MTIARRKHLTGASCLVLAGLWVAPALCSGADASESAGDTSEQILQDCLLGALAVADDTATVGSVKAQCDDRTSAQPDSFAVGPVNGMSPVEERIVKEGAVMDRNFILTAHEPNYLLATYNGNPNQAPFEEALDTPQPLNNEEVKFQVSIKAPIVRKPFGSNSDLFFAYTSTSWWQLGNSEISNPFRETNYQPEIFLRNYTLHRLFGLKISSWDLGFNHQSNGRSGDLSRSWNRVLGSTAIDLNDVAMRLRAWYRLPEDADSDDNPRMYRYVGYGDALAVWAPSKNTYSLMYRPGTQGGAVEITWSRPISKIWRIYAQYWNGYGESLIDYDYRTQRIGIGFALSDYLER